MREADVGQERAGEQVDFLVVDQFAGEADRVLRPAGVVAADHLDLAAEHAAGGVDLLDRELPAVAVGQREGGRRRCRS